MPAVGEGCWWLAIKIKSEGERQQRRLYQRAMRQQGEAGNAPGRGDEAI
jgi:hypothetical protein